MKILGLALALLLFAPVLFPAWTELLNISVTDGKGKPVENADVSLSYQASKSFSDSDGLVFGKTDSGGAYFANLTNVVASELESRVVRVSISHYYGGNFSLNDTAGYDPAFVKQLVFIVPFRLIVLNVRVADSKGAPVGNASVFLAGPNVKKATDALGVAVFSVAEGKPVSGAVTYQGKIYPFSGKGGKENISASVVVPAKAAAAKPGESFTFTLGIVGPDGKPLSNFPVGFAYLGENYTGHTDSGGNATFTTDQNESTLNVEFRKNEVDYNFSYELGNNRSERIALQPSLKINSFYAFGDGENCYRVVANISDPRAQLPIQARMVKMAQYTNSTLPLNIEEGGVFSSRPCVSSNVKVRLLVWNKYDSVESEPLELKYARPQPKLVYAPTEPVAKKENVSFEDVMLAVAAFGMLGALAGGIIVGKGKIKRAFQFMGAFLRQAMKKMQALGRKRRAPPIPKVPDAPPPQEPNMGLEIPIDETDPHEKD